VDNQRDFGRLEAQVERLKEDVEAMSDKLDLLMSYMSEARGSWKTVLALGGFAAAIGSVITWVVTHFWPK
jgi:hypothetical protein